MKRTSLRSKDVSEELRRYDIGISKKDQVELIEAKNHKFLFINKQPAFFYYENKLVPLLRYFSEKPFLKNVVIDMGAVKFIVNGADVMRPGIVDIDEQIAKNETVAIIDANNRKMLAVGIALFNGNEMKLMKNGKVIKNVHYVGDELWKFQS